MALDHASYINRILENLGYKRIEFPRDSDSRLRLLKVKHDLGLEGRLACLFFDSKGNLVMYEPPRVEDKSFENADN